MTEKNYNPEQRQKSTMNKQEKAIKVEKKIEEARAEKLEKKEERQEEKQERQQEKNIEKAEAKEKKEEKKKERPKKTKVFVRGENIPISTKYSMAICRFIKRKRVSDAIRDLEQVAALRKPVPMKGEIPHRKGQIMSGRFPQTAAKHFIILLKSLASNCIYHGLEDPVITEAFANIGARPFGRRGIRRKRTHVTVAAENIKRAEKEERQKEKAAETKEKKEEAREKMEEKKEGKK